MEDQKFAEAIIRGIVGNPNDVKIDRTVDERGVLLSVNLNPSDIGYVIGKKGQTVNAIRTLVKVIGAKNNARVNLKIVEPEGSERFKAREAEQAAAASDTSTDIVDDFKI